MERIIFATGNQGKLKELKELLADLPYEIVSMKDAGIHTEIDENGTTFEENALIKAGTVAKLTGVISMADDSGLEIDYLDKAPGVYSARFLGEDTSYDVKNRYILDKLAKVPEEKRTARFVCAAACVYPDGRSIVTRETIEGRIAWEPAGENGFGYDPIFYVPAYGKTTAELSLDAKNKISHRARAFIKLKEQMKCEGDIYENPDCE